MIVECDKNKMEKIKKLDGLSDLLIGQSSI
jgi:hypothetical protein